ncbi:hypothetical protein H2248_005382 [Termitomyces sp. 'cryptogamus']|nr:hypothetical protein H2248_005382 [Termitomyces sp. 'cryptogamus']
MAASNKEVLTPFLLRSSTPAANEKVLRYLEGMSREGDEPDNTPPRSLADADEFRSKVGSPRARSPLQVPSPAARSRKSETLLNPVKSPMSYAKHQGSQVSLHDDDADSNAQEGRTSEAGDTMNPREPGPHDPPGPKYESYDSGPSFGNFGPLPPDDHVPVPAPNFSSWNPNWAQIQSKSPPPSHVPWNSEEDGHEGVQSVQATKIPLPPSEYAMSPRGIKNDINGHEELMSPRSNTQIINGKARAMSPSGRSQLSKSTTPLSPRLMSPQARSKAPSISPSESPSQVRPQQTPSRNRGSSSILSGNGHQTRPFSPYRHGPTTEDLLHAAIRGRAIIIPEEEEKASSVASATNRSKTHSQVSKAPSQPPTQLSRAPSQQSRSQVSATQPQMNGNGKAPSVTTSRQGSEGSHHSHHEHVEGGDATPRVRSMDEHDLDQVEAHIVRAALAAATPRTSYYAEPLEPNFSSHYHDMELCVLLHQEADPSVHDVVKRALRKAVVQRVKKLGMKYDHESLKQYKRSHMDHNPLHQDNNSDEPPQWATDIKREIVLMQQRIESLGPKIENLRPHTTSQEFNDSRFAYQDLSDSRTPRTQTVHLQTQPTGTAADSMFRGAQTDITIGDDGVARPRHQHNGDEDDVEFDNRTETRTMERRLPADTAVKRGLYGADDRDDSPGQQYLEEELYRLRQRQRQGGSQSGRSHHTWLVSRDPGEIDDDDEEGPPPSGMPTIPDTNGGGYAEREGSHSPPLPALPEQEDEEEIEPHGGVITTPQGPWRTHDYDAETSQPQMAPWQRIHARLLQWAVIWPQPELDNALNSTTRGQQVDEIALSIWTTQTYKRYVRARLTDNPAGIVDRLFVPPNMADAISNAVYNGQHGNACGMLREMWTTFGLPGMPRLLVVLARHRSENDHWVVHRYSLPEGTLMTYDSYTGRSIMDGRPLGWWFAIRIAWPNANYPSPDHLEQKMVRLHRPAQLPIDNSVAAAGIWRNILMGSRGERSLDLERLRDLINTEVKNLRQRKILGRLSITAPRQALNWEH